MEQLLKIINETVEREGIDLIGFAPKSRFEVLPPETNAALEYYDYVLNHTGYFAICGARGCIRACMNALERADKIESKFHNKFYKKPSWLLPNQPEQPPKGVNPYREAYLDEKYPGIRENEYERK